MRRLQIGYRSTPKYKSDTLKTNCALSHDLIDQNDDVPFLMDDAQHLVDDVHVADPN